MGWTVRGSSAGGGRDFPHPSRPALGPTQPPIQRILGVFPGSKAAGAWRWQPKPSSDEVKERVELCLCSLYGPSWPLRGRTFIHDLKMWPRAAQSDLAAGGLATRGPTYENGPACLKLGYFQLDYWSWHMLTFLTAIRVVLSDAGYEVPLLPSTKA